MHCCTAHLVGGLPVVLLYGPTGGWVAFCTAVQPIWWVGCLLCCCMAHLVGGLPFALLYGPPGGWVAFCTAVRPNWWVGCLLYCCTAYLGGGLPVVLVYGPPGWWVACCTAVLLLQRPKKCLMYKCTSVLPHCCAAGVPRSYLLYCGTAESQEITCCTFALSYCRADE